MHLYLECNRNVIWGWYLNNVTAPESTVPRTVFNRRTCSVGEEQEEEKEEEGKGKEKEWGQGRGGAVSNRISHCCCWPSV